jgi:integrase
MEQTLERFVDNLRGQSRSNRYNYRHRVGSLLAMVDTPLAEIAAQDVNRWLRGLEATRSPVTVAGHRQAVKTFFNWCVEEGLIERSPAAHLRVGRVAPDVVAIPDERDVAAVTAVAHRWSRSAEFVERRAAFVWLYCLESGCRRGGLLALRRHQFRAPREIVRGSGVYTFDSREKTGRVVHQVTTLSIEAARRMLSLRPASESGALLVGSRSPFRALSASGVAKDFINICAEAEVRAILSHALRHRIGDVLTREYSPKIAAKKLNHRGIETTMLWYHRADESDVAVATAAMAARVGEMD